MGHATTVDQNSSEIFNSAETIYSHNRIQLSLVYLKNRKYLYMLTINDLEPLWLTLKLASISTIVLLVLCTPIAWWLSQSQSIAAKLTSSVLSLPLVLPPTVLGFYLLLFMGPHGALGQATRSLGLGSLSFTFTGLVIGSVIYSLPFVIQPLQNSFEAIGSRPLDIAATLRATPLDRFFTIAMPMAKSGFFVAAILGFAHTVGEFGVVLMLGGNIPGQTKVLSIAIYDHVEALDYTKAHLLSAIMLSFSFLILLALNLSKKKIRITP